MSKSIFCKVSSVPTVVAIKKGKVVNKFIGLKDDDRLKAFVEDVVEKWVNSSRLKWVKGLIPYEIKTLFLKKKIKNNFKILKKFKTKIKFYFSQFSFILNKINIRLKKISKKL